MLMTRHIRLRAGLPILSLLHSKQEHDDEIMSTVWSEDLWAVVLHLS